MKPCPQLSHSSQLTELLHQALTPIMGAKGLYAVQGGKAHLLGSRHAEQPELVHGFLVLPLLGVSDPAETLLWVSSVPTVEGPEPLLWRGVSTHVRLYRIIESQNP